jgi:SAM-dependent methyltransferase
MKQVLDPCCGCKMMWFDKEDNRAIFADKRKGEMKIDHLPSQFGRSSKKVDPDKIHDFRNMDFEDESFWHIVFDPPHVKNISLKSVTGFSYGSLDKDTWRDDLRKGFLECFRVLKTNGTLIFKWNEIQIPLKEVLSLTKYKPLYGHRSGKKALTHWVAFIKTEEEL